MAETPAPDAISATEATVAEPTGGRPSPAMPRGARVGRYTVLGEVGRGAMGAVYAAYDPDLDRKIALKVLHGEGGPEHAQRLIREARALASLSHPNVVTVHDVGVVDGRGFIATEFIDGQTLRDWLDAADRSVDQVLTIMREAGRGLVAAHAAGVVHRDFKPQNVMVDRRGRVVVMDFGLARRAGEHDLDEHLGDPQGGFGATSDGEARDPEDTDVRAALQGTGRGGAPLNLESSPRDVRDADLTTTGAVMGTPAYMSLEQHRGHRASAASDQFSYCVVLYEALTGARPFTGSSRLLVAYAIRQGRIEPWPPGSAVPARIRHAVERGLAAKPAGRWPDMATLLTALAPTVEPTRRRLAMGATAAGLVVASVAVGAWWSGGEGRVDPCAAVRDAGIGEVWDARRAAQLERQFARSDLSYAAATATRVEARLDAYTDRWIAGRIDACEAFQHRKLQTAAVHEARVRCFERAAAQLDATVGLLAEADDAMVRGATDAIDGLPDLDRCDDEARLLDATPIPDDPRSAAQVAAARRRLVQAEGHRLAGALDTAETHLEAAAKAAGAMDPGFLPLLAELDLARAELAKDAGEFPEAAEAATRAYLDARRAGHDEVAVRASTALVYLVGYRLADYPRAELWARIARAEADRVGDDTRHHARIVNSEGILHGRQGRFEKARAHYLEANERYRRIDATDEPGYEATFTNLGLVSINLGDGPAARRYLEEGYARTVKRYGADHPRAATSLVNLSAASLLAGEIDAALDEARRAVTIASSPDPAARVSFAAAQEALGRARMARGEFDGATEAFERALEIKRARLGTSHPATAELATRLAEARLHAAPDDPAVSDAAVREASAALELLETRFGPSDPRAGEAASVLATALSRSGRDEDRDRARDLAQRTLASLDAEAHAGRVARARAELVLAALRRGSEPAEAKAASRRAAGLLEGTGALGQHLR